MQGRLYRSLKLWSFYCDLEESLGTLESTQAVYDRILDLRIATPQLILNYALFLQACCFLPACPCTGHSQAQHLLSLPSMSEACDNPGIPWAVMRPLDFFSQCWLLCWR